MPFRWTRLIRFTNPYGEVFYADTAAAQDAHVLIDTEVPVLTGDPFYGFVALGGTQTIRKARTHPSVLCRIGLMY